MMSAIKSLENAGTTPPAGATPSTSKTRTCFCHPWCPLDDYWGTTPPAADASVSASTSKLSKPSFILSKTTPSVVPPTLYPDWSPLDDNITKTPSNSIAKPPTRAAVDDYIGNVLYGGPSRRRNRLLVFREICPDDE